MPYENFPYADLHNLNLDWLLKQVKEDHDTLTGINFQALVEAAVQQAIDDGTIADLINNTIFNALNTKVNTLEIKSIVYDMASEDATVAMLGCPAADTLDAARGYSLCVVVHSPHFCIVYDMGNDNAATLLSYLNNNAISTIDMMIISHYHSDHVQTAGVSNLLASGIEIEKWYLPHGSIDWNSYIGTGYASVENAVKTLITNAGQGYVEAGVEGFAEEPHGRCRVELYNVNPALFSGYYSYQLDEDGNPTAHTNYNNFSMCAKVYVGGRVLVLTGDIEEPAQEKMAPIVAGADILQIPHHGLDLLDNEDFRGAMSGTIFLTAAYGVSRYYRLENISNLMLARAREMGASVSTLNDRTIICTMGASGCALDPDYAGYATPAGCFGDVLRPGADLDDLVQIGRVYFIQNASDAAGISNIPETGAGKVYIMGCNQNSNDLTGSIMQYYEANFSYAHPKIFVRWKYEGTWTSWMQYEATSI